MIIRQSKKSIINRVRQNINHPHISGSIKTVEDISSTLESFSVYTKKIESSIFEKGIELGIEKTQLKTAEKMLENNIAISDIHKITGLSLAKIEQIRKKLKKK